MSDIFAPQPIKTKSNGDAAVKIVDATTVAQGLAVDSGGNASVNVGKVAGSAIATGASGIMKVAVTDGTGTAITSTSSAIDVNIKSGSSSGAVAQGSTTSGQTGSLVQGAVTTAAPSYTTAQTDPLSLTTSGALRVDVGSTSANGTAIKVDGSAVTQPVSVAAAVTVSQATAANLEVDLSGTAANATAIKVDGSAVTQPTTLSYQGTVTDDYSTSAALAAGATVTLDSTNIGSGTGHLVEATCSSSVALKAQLGTWDGTTFTVKRTFFIPANGFIEYTPTRNDSITKATGATAKFRWSITNNDNANAADVYCSTTYWN